jgi:predicted ATPase/DNA-binding SARP family transcriptional activator
MPTALHIRLLGGLQVVYGDHVVNTLHSSRLQSLFARLVMQAGVPQSRTHLAFSFWPDSGEAQARTNLRKLVHHLQRALPDAERFVSVEGPALTWRADAPYTLDVAAFEAALHQAHTAAAIAHAVALYRDDLLPGCYDDWTVAERDRLRNAFVQVLHHGITLHEAEHDYTQALGYAQRLVQHDPLHEVAYRQLMRLHALNGDRAAALCAYRTCVHVLRRELDVEPDQTTHDLYQRIRKQDIVAAAAPLLSVSPPAPPTNLPVPLTPFIGREREGAAVIERLRGGDVRLLTLTGTGGTGKTRLALQVGASLRQAFNDGVFWVDLSPVRDPALVPSAIAHALGVTEAGNQPLVERFKIYLRTKHMLMLLDNVEQVLAAGSFVTDMLQAAPHVHVLCTSREALHVYGEHLFDVPPMALPDPDQALLYESLVHDEAVRLFIYHAQAVNPRFVFTPQHALCVVELCRRLDGLPLAIEIAAARSQFLPLPTMVEQMQDRFALLVDGWRDKSVRHQTLHATIEWSYTLLDAHEQCVFRRLAVFIPGCTAAAAEAVCNVHGEVPRNVHVVLQSLVNKSLLRREEQHGSEPRFRMLETIREYALSRLESSGEAELVRQQHAAFFVALAEQAEPALFEAQQAAWVERLEAEHDNLRAALQWALECGEVEMVLRLSGGLCHFWWTRGHLSEGRRWLDAALTASSAYATPLRAKACFQAGGLAYSQGDYAQAAVLLENSVALARAFSDQQALAYALLTGGNVAADQGDYARAVALYEESLVLTRTLDDTVGSSMLLANLGWAVIHQNDYARATALLEESLALSRERGDTHIIATCLNNLGLMALYRGRPADALPHLQESLALCQASSYKVGIVANLEGVVGIAAAHRQPERVAWLLDTAEALRETIAAPMSPADQAPVERVIAAARTQLDEATWQATWNAGRAMSLHQAVTYVLNEWNRAS